MSRVYNFSAGPSCLPEEVLKSAAAEMMDYNGTGQSVMEMSHRSKAYEPIIAEAESLIRELMNIPENYKVLFLQGGASTQFAMIPMNLKKNGKAAYINTGVWSKKAIAEAKEVLQAYNDYIFADYRGLTVEQISELRKKLRELECEFKVVKNNFARVAFEELEITSVSDYLAGPTAIALVKQDSNEAAKVLFDFAKETKIDAEFIERINKIGYSKVQC